MPDCPKVDMAEDSAIRHWHLDKRVNVGHILTTVVLAISAFSWGSAMDRRLAVVEASVVQNAKDNDRQDTAMKETAQLLRNDLRTLHEDIRDISRKLDQQHQTREKGK